MNNRDCFNKGMTYLEQGDYVLAVEYFTDAFNNATERDDLADALFKRGEAQHLLGQNMKASADYNKAFELYTNDEDKARACFRRGDVNLQRRHYSQATVDFEKAYDLSRNSIDQANACNNRGLANQAQGYFAQAIFDLTRALHLQTDLAEKAKIYFNRADVYLSGSLFAKAMSDLHHAIQLDPTMAEFAASLAQQLPCAFLRQFYKDFYPSYLAIKSFLPNRTRLELCEEQGNTSLFIDSRTKLLMNTPVVLPCCGETFDLETVQASEDRNCPDCHASISQTYLNEPIINRRLQKCIDKHVADQEEASLGKSRLSPVVSAQCPNQTQKVITQASISFFDLGFPSGSSCPNRPLRQAFFAHTVLRTRQANDACIKYKPRPVSDFIVVKKAPAQR